MGDSSNEVKASILALQIIMAELVFMLKLKLMGLKNYRKVIPSLIASRIPS